MRPPLGSEGQNFLKAAITSATQKMATEPFHPQAQLRFPAWKWENISLWLVLLQAVSNLCKAVSKLHDQMQAGHLTRISGQELELYKNSFSSFQEGPFSFRIAERHVSKHLRSKAGSFFEAAVTHAKSHEAKDKKSCQPYQWQDLAQIAMAIHKHARRPVLFLGWNHGKDTIPLINWGLGLCYFLVCVVFSWWVWSLATREWRSTVCRDYWTTIKQSYSIRLIALNHYSSTHFSFFFLFTIYQYPWNIALWQPLL